MLVGREMKQMIEAFLNGNVTEAAKLHVKLHPVFKELFELPNPVLVKGSLGLRGIPVGGVRLPLVTAAEHELEVLKGLLN